MPGSRIASTESPASSAIESSGDLGLAVADDEISLEPCGSATCSIVLPAQTAVRADRQLDDLVVLLAQLEQVDQPVLGHLVLDQAHDRRGRRHRRRDAEQVEVRLVARIVDAGDHLLDAVALARELADDDVVLVVARDRDDDVGRALDARRARARRARSRRPCAPGARTRPRACRSASVRCSISVTSCPLRISVRARFEPTLPPPAIRTYISAAPLRRPHGLGDGLRSRSRSGRRR